MVFEISLSHHNAESLELTKALSIAEARCQGARQKQQVRRLELLLLGGGELGAGLGGLGTCTFEATRIWSCLSLF